MMGYYDRAGNEISRDQWGALKNDSAYCVVAVDELPKGFTVSTVWLGMKSGMSYNPAPLIFETMVFWPNSSSEADTDRYATEAEAKKGHEEMYLRWLAGLLDGSLPPAGEPG